MWNVDGMKLGRGAIGRCRVCSGHRPLRASGCCCRWCEDMADRRARRAQADAVFAVLFLGGLVMLIVSLALLLNPSLGADLSKVAEVLGK